MMRHAFALLAIMLAITFNIVKSESVLVTIQTQSQESMDTLTAAIDTEAQNSGGPWRTTLGAIEATASRVVDVDSPYLQTVPRSVPTLAILENVEYSSSENKWTFTYQSMRIDPNDSLNQFKRILYMTKRTVEGGHSWGIGDSTNICLQREVNTEACLTALETSYTVPQTLTPDDDFLIFSSPSGDDIVSQVTDTPNSLLQTITITIPHSRIRNQPEPIAHELEKMSQTEGYYKEYTFGIGMLFHGSGNNQIIFDQFRLIENSREQLAISRENSYAIAKHVSFWTQRVKHDPETRIAIIEYLLDAGYSLNSVNASINGQQVMLHSDCVDMQARMDTLPDSSCLSQYPLCEAQTYMSTEGDVQTWATYVLPLPSWASSPFRIVTLLNTTGPDGRDVLSTLNFETSNPPSDVCANAIVQDFAPTDHVDVFLYRGHDLDQEIVQGTFTVSNSTAIGMPDSLMTLAFTPKDAAAVEYFANTNEYINLDDLYMSHALSSSELPDDITNTMTGITNGRGKLVLDPALLINCPLDTSQEYEQSTATCVTTHDWDETGRLNRESSQHLYFVRRVTGSVSGEDSDLSWLQSNIYAGDSTTAADFLTRTEALVSADVRGITQIYWIWPIFQWFDASPIGLKDSTVVSFAWSVSASVPTNRRLLGLVTPQIGFDTPIHYRKQTQKDVQVNARSKSNSLVEKQSNNIMKRWVEHDSEKEQMDRVDRMLELQKQHKTRVHRILPSLV